MALSQDKKNKILKTFRQANLGEAAVKGTGFRQQLFQAFKNNGAKGVLNRINQFRTDNGNEFGKIKYTGDGKLNLKKIRKSISDPEQLARDLNVPLETFDEAGARAGQEEMKQYFADRTADQQIGYDRQGEDLNTNEGYFNEDIATQRANLTTSREQQLRNRALVQSGENINQNNSLASAGTYDSPAAQNLKRRLAEIQGLRSDQEDTGYNENVNAINTSATRGTTGYTTGRARLGQDTTLFAKERERQLQELLGSDIEAKREKFYNQQSLPSSSLNLNARY